MKKTNNQPNLKNLKNFLQIGNKFAIMNYKANQSQKFAILNYKKKKKENHSIFIVAEKK